MHKSIDMNALRERNGLRILVAISLTFFLAGLGACTTNYTPGNGQPTSSPSYGSTPRGSTYGSSSGTQGSRPQSQMILAPEVITPMYSSSSEAIAVLAGHQGRFLGYSNPGPASASYDADIVTGQVIPPALTANPEQTVNSSISSGPNSVITSGGGGGDVGGAAVIGGLTSEVTAGVTATTAASTAISAPLSAAAPIFGTPSTIATPTNVATTAAVNQNTGFLTPTVTSGATPSPTLAANPPVASVGTTSTTASAVTTPATVTPTISRSASRSATGSLSVPRPVRMTTSSGGSVVITNQ